MTASVLLNNISILSAIFPVIAAVKNRLYLNNVLKIAAAFFVLSAMFDLLLVMVMQFGLSNNAPILHLFIALSTCFFTWIYFEAFYSPALKKITVILGAITLIVVLFNAVGGDGIFAYPSISNTAESIYLIILALLYFYQLLTRQEFIHIEKQALFWINSGVLIYFSVNIFLFMLFSRILTEHIQNFWVIHSVSNLIANLLYAIGLLCRPQKTT